jgi:hypothetical protein
MHDISFRLVDVHVHDRTISAVQGDQLALSGCFAEWLQSGRLSDRVNADGPLHPFDYAAQLWMRATSRRVDVADVS